MIMLYNLHKDISNITTVNKGGTYQLINECVYKQGLVHTYNVGKLNKEE